jgi:molecular chaperone DnaJ
MSRKDFYAILGLEKNAGEKEIKSAYRKLAKKFHPDLNQGNKLAEERFKEVSDAYEILSDQEKKSLYDEFEASRAQRASQNADKNQQETHSKSNSEDQEAPYTGSDRIQGNKKKVNTEFSIGFEEAVFGCNKILQLSGINGKKIEVHVPAGINEGQCIRLRDGDDLEIRIRINIQEKPGYERKGLDIYTTQNIPYTVAVLGGEACFTTLYGDVRCKIREGTQSGTKIRLKGKGVVSMNNPFVRGDEYVTVGIEVPTGISAQERRMLERYARWKEQSHQT